MIVQISSLLKNHNPCAGYAEYRYRALNNFMLDDQKIHQVLEYICTKEDQSSFETDEIADGLGFSLSETNVLAREIINNGDAKDCGSKDTNRKGTVCLLKL